MRIHHIATASDWRRARRTGSYTTSTRDRSLAVEGFIHAARPEQVRGVFERHYADHDARADPLVLLTVDTEQLDRLGVPWREEPGVPGGETFPHVYDALPTAAVSAAQPLDARGRTASLGSLVVGEMMWRISLAVAVMTFAGVAGIGAEAVWGEAATFPAAVGGLVLGTALAVLLHRRRR